MSDILGILGQDESPDDGWEVLLVGEETRRPAALKRVAMTRVEVTLGSEKDLDTFLDIIKASDDRLKVIPDSDVRYDWQRVSRKGLTIRFGVAWYDVEFYRDRRNAYRSDMHAGVLAQFNIKADDLRVEHIALQQL